MKHVLLSILLFLLTMNSCSYLRMRPTELTETISSPCVTPHNTIQNGTFKVQIAATGDNTFTYIAQLEAQAKGNHIVILDTMWRKVLLSHVQKQQIVTTLLPFQTLPVESIFLVHTLLYHASSSKTYKSCLKDNSDELLTLPEVIKVEPL